MRVSLAKFAPLALLLCGTSAIAQSGPWTISEVNGSVTIVDADGARTAQIGTMLDSGDKVSTGEQSSAVLVRGREFVTVRQNSQIQVPEEQRERSVIQIIQDFGRALFNIGKQPDPHFGVETPYLAAVVKGTTFTVSVGEEGASVQVSEGAVEVSTLDGGASDLVLPGAAAIVLADDNRRLIVEGEERKIIDSPNRTVTAPASSAASSLGFSTRVPSVQRINATIVSAPVDLDLVSDGFISGQNRMVINAVIRENASRGDRVRQERVEDSTGFGGEGDNSVCYLDLCNQEGVEQVGVGQFAGQEFVENKREIELQPISAFDPNAIEDEVAPSSDIPGKEADTQQPAAYEFAEGEQFGSAQVGKGGEEPSDIGIDDLEVLGEVDPYEKIPEGDPRIPGNGRYR